MNKQPFSSISDTLHRGALKIAGLYLLIGSLWILFSDRLADQIALNKEMLASLSLYKGWGYVIVTAFLLYWLIQRHTRRLHASEQQLQVVINALPVLISYIGTDQRYQFANEAYEEWFGEKAQGKHIEEVIGQAAYQKVSKYVDKVLNGETVSYEAEIPDREGGERFVSATYVPDLDVNGHVIGFFTLVQDISEQKEAREKLRQWADAFEGCAHGIAIGDPDTNRIVVCNPAFANMLKSKVEDVVGSSILSAYALSDHAHVRNNVERADQIGHTRYEAHMIRKDGAIFPVQMDLVSVIGEDGELLYRVATAQDISDRKQADQKIMHQARLLEQVNDAVIASDENFIVTSWNVGAERIFGWKAEEAIGRKSQEFLQAVVFDKTSSEVIQKIKEMGEFSAEVTQLRNDGSRIHIETRTVALRDESGQITGYVSISRDITKRKLAEEQLERSNQILNEILVSIQDDFYELDRDWNFVYASRLFTSKIGKEPEDFIGNNIWEMFPKHLGTVLEENFRAAMEKREIRRFEVGGKYTAAWYRMTAFPSAEGITVLGTDVTEHKQAEEELKKSEERYRYLFQNNPYPMWVYDRKTLAFLDVNEAAITKYGYSYQEFLNMTIVNIRPPEDVERLMDNLAKPRQPLESSTGWRHCLKDGTIIHVEITSHTVETDGHESALVVAQDVTERKRAEEALQQSEAMLRSVVDQMPSGVTVRDARTGALILSNTRSREIMGTLVNSANQFAQYRGFHPDGRPYQTEDWPVSRSIATGEVVDGEEIEYERSDGTRITLSISSAPIRDIQGKIVIGVGVVDDITEHKRAEENLRRFELLSEHSRDIILFMGRKDGQILEANAAAVRAYGYSRDELLALTIRDLRVSNTHDLTDDQMAQADAGGILFETIHQRKDGTTFPVEVSSQGATIGGVRTLISIVRDITERKRAEEALRISEERFRFALARSPIIVANLDRQLRYTWVYNPLAGFKPEDLVGKTVGLSTDPETRASILKLLEELLANGTSAQWETAIGTADGERFFQSQAEPLRDSQGKITGVTLLSMDITERKQAEEALQKAHDELELKVEERTAALSQANSLLQALMDTMPDQIYFKDLQCHFIRNSRSQASLLGLSDPAQVVGKTDFDFFPHATKAYAEEQEVMRSGKPLIDFEEWVVWPDGRETWVSTTKVPLRNSDGETIGIFGISRDITERKRTEQAIRELNSDLENQAAKLQAANKELEAFSYSVSHDLRAPLRAIDGYTRILVEDYEAILDTEGNRVCGIISAEARRMGQLIDDLLAFSRLGRKEMYSSTVDMKALVVSVLNDLLKEEDRERIEFHIQRLPSVKADSSLIRQVWINLLSNAIKFTSKKERTAVEVGSKSSKDEIIYFVHDTGAGFDMEYANKLFGVFQRLHSESEFEGTGVGLAIVQRIIRRHGGRVWAEGEVDQGATFYFALPRKENHYE